MYTLGWRTWSLTKSHLALYMLALTFWLFRGNIIALIGWLIRQLIDFNKNRVVRHLQFFLRINLYSLYDLFNHLTVRNINLVTADLQAILGDQHHDLLKVVMSTHASLPGIKRFHGTCSNSSGGVSNHFQRCALLLLYWCLVAPTGPTWRALQLWLSLLSTWGTVVNVEGLKRSTNKTN